MVSNATKQGSILIALKLIKGKNIIARRLSGFKYVLMDIRNEEMKERKRYS